MCVFVDIEAHKEYILHIANHMHSLDDGCSHSEGISYLMQVTFFFAVPITPGQVCKQAMRCFTYALAAAPKYGYNMTKPIPPIWSLLAWFRESMPPGMGAAR